MCFIKLAPFLFTVSAMALCAFTEPGCSHWASPRGITSLSFNNTAMELTAIPQPVYNHRGSGHGVTCPVSHRAQRRAGTGLLIQSLTITLRKQLLKMGDKVKRHMDLRDAKLGECQYGPTVQHRDRYSVRILYSTILCSGLYGKKSEKE